MNHKHVLKIEQWSKSEYAGFEAVEMWESESGNSYTISHYETDENHAYGKQTRGIRLYCQCNLYDNEPTRGMYAMDIHAMDEITMWDIERAEDTVKRIKSIEKKYKAICKKYGSPAMFAQFAAYIANIIGAELVEQSPYDTNEVISLDVETLKYRENSLLKR